MDYPGRISRIRVELESYHLSTRCLLRTFRTFATSADSRAAQESVEVEAPLFTDGRYAEQAAAEVVGAKIVIAKGAALIAAAKQAKRLKKASVGIEAEHLSVSAGDALAEVLPKGIRLKSTRGIVEALRMIKEPAEIDLLREAIDLGCELFRRPSRRFGRVSRKLGLLRRSSMPRERTARRGCRSRRSWRQDRVRRCRTAWRAQRPSRLKDSWS